MKLADIVTIDGVNERKFRVRSKVIKMNEMILWHAEENRLREKIKDLDPNNEVLKVIYHSTYAAIEAYQDALTKYHMIKGEK